jgi:hypothetical protein
MRLPSYIGHNDGRILGNLDIRCFRILSSNVPTWEMTTMKFGFFTLPPNTSRLALLQPAQKGKES